MRSMDAQNRLPEVATDQFALDQTLKHLRKLRWIGREREAQRIFEALGDIRLRPSRSIDWGQLNTRFANLRGNLTVRPCQWTRDSANRFMTETMYSIFVAPLRKALDEAVSEKRLPSCSSPRHPPQLGRPWRRYPRPARASSGRPSPQQQPEHLTSPAKRSSSDSKRLSNRLQCGTV